jgi:hypothetical protein
MTTDYDATGSGQAKANGSGILFRDSKLGNLANGAVAALALYLADWLGELDVTPLPDAIEPLALAGIATAVGLLTSKVARRR